MADAGGGKIRTRRYHNASKPYAKGKQQQGIIGRVTDTVKNIVPGWLQKYFKNDDPTSAEAGDVEETADGRENHDGQIQNNQGHTDEEILPFPDRRHTPEPSTSNAGIIGRVTDTVKNIVPGWLQKYFKNDDPTSAEAGDVEETADGRENHDGQIQNNQGHTDEEILPFPDRRHTPEPSTSNAEPSTSQSALNFSIQPRPPLNRSHLNFATLNSPALHCQPSTSTAFPIGSSGFSLIKEIKDSTSQHEDDNISTTSGFSSRASDKDVTTSKNMLPVWSPEAERSQSVPQQAGTSLRKPAFNLSVFGGSSTSLASTSALNSSQLGDSLFYPGKTTYGGAAAVRSPSSRVRGTPYQSDAQHPPVQKLVTPKAASVAVNRSMFFKPSLTPTGHSSRSTDRAGFTFSAPVSKTVASDPSGTASTPSATPVKNSTSSSAVGTLGNTNDEDFDGPFRPARALKQGSVLDILKGPVPVKPFQMSSTSSPTGGFGFGDKFKPATGSWQCDACLLQNKPTDSKCVACQTAKPNIDSSKQSKCSKMTSETLPSLGDKFKPVSGTWECDTCLVQNKPEVTKCVACETSKPGTGVKSALTLPAFSESKLTVGSDGSGSTSITTTTSSLSSGFGFGEKFKKPEGAWDCDVCLVQNKAEDIKCVSCQCAKPGAVAVPSTAMTAPEPSGGLLGFGDIFKKPEGSWDCEVCAVQNKAEVMQCVACQSAKPGAKVETKGFSSSALSSATTASPFGGVTGGFQFGDQGGIKFGTSTTDNASSGGGFKFGMAKSEDSRKPDSQTIGSGFKFGTGGGIQFGTGNSSSQSENKAAEPKGKLSLEGFTFGLSAPPKADEKTADGGFKIGAPKEKPELGGTAAAMPFSFGKQEEKKLSGEQLPAVGFAFGKPVEEKTGTLAPAAASTFMLGKTDKPDPVSSSSNLMFGKGKETDKPATELGFSFGKPEPTKEEAKPAFSFGKPAEKQEAAVQPKPAFAFGAAPPTADQGASKPAYNFMASRTASATVTAASTTSSTPSTNMFGSSSTSASIAPVSTFMFGQASSTGFASGASETSTCSKSFMFGAQESKAAAAPAAGASPFMFVTGSNTAATAFGFGSTASAAPTTTTSTGASASQFVFGSASSTPASAPAFGNIQTPAFGQGSNQPSAPAFGSPAAALFSAGSQPPAFGSQASTSQPSVFGQQSNQPPAFGAAVAASAAPGKNIKQRVEPNRVVLTTWFMAEIVNVAKLGYDTCVWIQYHISNFIKLQ
ncbi:UNVERIFIED_CONTAM: hypothetical protein FKN15_045837 [Acipenser sinensis]